MNLESVELKSVAIRESQYPPSLYSEFLLVGRSNVGKSSFINAIIMRKNFAHTSSKPGKTETLNFYLINKKFYIVDIPGYGYSKLSKEKDKKIGVMIEEYLKKRETLSHVFLLVDYRHKPTEDDILMYNFLKYYNIPVTVVATKYDKVSPSNRDKSDKQICSTLKIDSFIKFSATTKKGREDIYKIINENLHN
jgi:GTP-binding protein